MASNHDEYIRNLYGNEDSAIVTVNKSISQHGMPAISIKPEVARLLTLLVKMSKPRNVMEIGALGGYSGIVLAHALDKEGALTSLELEESYANVARENLTKAGFGDKVKYVIGPALQNMESLYSAGQHYDFFFIDADKGNYPAYLDMAIKLASPGAVIVADNTLQGDRVFDDKVEDESVNAIRTFNNKMANDERLESIIIPLCDGLTIGRVKSGTIE
ncbi:O-methyltransferase [Pseudalkalibacillus hwajinpoensis]|uniref:O-methyltransferase n=1 Tax=Guptibacillus hwajinpoensis TaxID=208199 RepID=UPI00325AB3E1